MPNRRLVTGGARSGKSCWAEQQLTDCVRVDYVATSHWPDDPDWAERVRLHQQRRPASWNTIETIDLVSVLASDDGAPVLIDCLGVWLTRVMDEAGVWEQAPGADERLAEQVSALSQAWEATERDVIAVTNEVGMGVVPETPAGRRYRDELGRLNAALAAHADEVWLAVAGIVRRWK